MALFPPGLVALLVYGWLHPVGTYDRILVLAVAVILPPPAIAMLVLQARALRFRRWIVAHWSEVAAGRAAYEGVPLDWETPLVRYRLGFSCLAVAVWGWAGPVVPSTPSARRTRRLSLFVTGIAGWWSLSGLDRTLPALRATVRDAGDVVTLWELADATIRARPLSEDELETDA